MAHDEHTRVTVAALALYPVKGCRAIAVDSADIRATGFAYHGVRDREWMLIDSSGRFMTQREVPQLALIAVSVEHDSLVLARDGHSSCRIPLHGGSSEVRDV